jgi:indolepyruvate ferredoxin oxidoreductase
VQLASLPDGVRGYEEVKLRNVESYHRSLAELRAQLDAPAAGAPDNSGSGCFQNGSYPG